MVKKITAKAKSPMKKRSTAKSSAVKSGAKNKKVQAVKRVVQKVPKKKVSILVLVVLAMASVVTVAWLFDKV